MTLSMEHIKESFRLFDSDGSGEIDQQEMKLAMLSLGWQLEDSEVLDMMTAIDKDGDAKINYDEFEKMMVDRTAAKDSEEEAKRAFKLFDLDKSDTITVDNMVEVARQLGENAEDMRSRIESYITAASGGEQAINLQQWLAVMDSVKSMRSIISPRP
eukprot:TRINITY_DN22154_c0_g1_i1.p1 TRINITY_DN22154_c0_g1~~TRINITY_DN22154_c0_g1_i1.p1  ORF type:complete len:157 (+),score=38.21 TRINITY_DN22154_c0_g1_i1:320-790(+)